ncbi:DNA translocase FtsK 4TM domain-containing protein [Paenibacillus sp.]|uniref:FtsK/SpoIIIE family DNA translocase n=1 Tax=Paenibacillus sp. TaxID=58172 RepID=UPI00282A124C|nr:DNA translocase FtsK 4TM domain-containing protein [Paenibacillus sp.]MDR0270019.1 DNA translocase FtsK [Paenibacillus sp.]
MAKRKKRKKASLTNVLKYEIYGIILITLSVIALSGEAAVGWSLSKMFGLLLGRFYFVIPLIGIYLGLSVMIQRKWPSRWNMRKSGIVLLVLALTLMSSVSSLEKKLAHVPGSSASHIVTQVHTDLQASLLSSTDSNDHSIINKDISGGYVGALQYALLFWLFGNIGTKLLLIVMFIISFMLITNLSYVDLMRIVRKRMVQAGSNMQKRMASHKQQAVASAPKASVRKRQQMLLPDEDEEDELEDFVMPKAKRSTPVFFQLFGSKFAKPPHDQDSALDDELDGTDILEPIGKHSRNQIHQTVYRNGEEHDEFSSPADHSNRSGPDPSSPIIRDFFEQVKSEGSMDEEEWDENELMTNMPHETSRLAAHEETRTSSGQVLESNTAAGDLLHAEEAVQAAEVSPPSPPPKPYKLPPFRLLAKPQNGGKAGDQNDYMQTARKLEATLESFGVRAKVLEVVRGPAVTRYEIQPDIGVKVSRIVSLTDDIALALAAKDIRMEAPIPGKSAIGIEVPNNEVSLVTMREVMETPIFQDAQSKLSIAFGRDISGQTIVGNLAKMPHLLVAGATGSGKSVCINGIITSILYKAKPDEVKFLMVDPKMVELNVYNGIPHLMAPVVTDPKRASLALKKIVVEMEKRYELFSKSGTRNIEGYNNLMKDNLPAVLPYIVVIVDELADLMMVAAHDVEEAITRLAQMARAAGIHLIIATQRPSVDVITGVIKANIPSRIAFGVSSQVDSRTILDMAGAEKLLGRGDMLFMPMGSSKPIRVQGAFMTDQEVETIVNYVREQGEAKYDETLVPEVDESQPNGDEELDELYDQAVQIVLEAKQASVSLLQRRMRVGYTRAARLIDSMEARGIIGPYEGSKPREVLVSLEQYQQQNRISS